MTKDQAQTFVRDFLNVKIININEACQENLDYLNQIIAAYVNKVPFQNFSFLSQTPEDQKLPTIQQVIDDVTSGAGGLCWTNNSVMFLILKAIGFTVDLINADVAERGLKGHTIVVAKNVVRFGDTYLVEAGMGNPTFRATNLDFIEESDTVSLSFNTYKYVKRGDEYIRMHKTSSDFEPFPHSEGEWDLVYFFKLDPLTLEQDTEIMQKACDGPTFYFRNNLRGVVFNNNVATAVKTENEKAVILKENEENKLKQSKEYDVQSEREDLVKELIEIFPLVPQSDITMAIENYLKFLDK